MLNGKHFGFMTISTVQRASSKVVIVSKTSGEIVLDLFEKAGMRIERVTHPYVNLTDPIIMIDMQGRLLWFNPVFRETYQMKESEILENFLPYYGMEDFNDRRDDCYLNLPRYSDSKGIQFIRVDGTNGFVLGFIVLFKSLNICFKTTREQASDLLRTIGYDAVGHLEEDQRSAMVVHITGKLIYMNPSFKRTTLREDSDLMMDYLPHIFKSNEHIRIPMENVFYHDRPDVYSLVTEFDLPRAGIRAKYNMVLVR